MILPHTLTELTAPVFGETAVSDTDNDLTRQHDGEPLGERIVVAGRVLDGDGRPLRGQLDRDLAGQRRGPLPPHGRQAPRAARPELHRRRARADRRRGPLPVRDDQAGRLPVAQPPQRLASGPHPLLAVRPRLHASGWSRRCTSRATRCSRIDPIFQSVRDARAARAADRAFDLELTEPEWALGYRFDIVAARPRRDADRGPDDDERLDRRPPRRSARSSTSACSRADRPHVVPRGHAGRDRDPRGGCSTAPGAPVPDGMIETWQADPGGPLQHPADPRGLRSSGFTGFGRSGTDDGGRVRVRDRRSRAAFRPPTAACRRRTSTSACSPAGC